MKNEAYPYNLIRDVLEISQSDFIASVEYVLHSLGERKCDVLKKFYRDNMTMEEIGEEYGVTRERIRQSLEKSKRELSSPDMRKYLIYGVKGVERMRLYGGMPCELANITVGNMGLSIRSQNCLSCAGAKTAQDVYKMGKELRNVRNLGLKSREEVIGWFEERGIDTNVFTETSPSLSESDNDNTEVGE